MNTAPTARIAFAIFTASCIVASARAQDPLPSWNACPAKKAILSYVDRTTYEGHEDYIAPDRRIAVFDNDGTLWAEKPIYVQFAFAIDRLKALAPEHPEWKDKEPFKSFLADDVKAAVAGGEKAVMEVLAATHAGMTTDEFETTVREWIATAKNPVKHRLYVRMVYQPMLEVLVYLRKNGFKTHIVSGGGVEFMRPWTARVYGIPPEQVIGSRGKLKYQLRDGQPVLLKLPEIELVDDGRGKPVGIEQMIGRRPVIAFGNSDGDFEMLQWTTAEEPWSGTTGKPSPNTRLALIVHHTDAEREWAYDRDSAVGKLDKALDAAPANGWIVIDMKNDWKTIFPGQ